MARGHEGDLMRFNKANCKTMNLVAVLALLMQNVQTVGEELDAATLSRMQQREVYLREQMTRLLQEIETEQSRMGMPALLFAVLRSWQFWALAAVLITLVMFIQLHWKRRREMYVRRVLEAFSSKEKEKEEDHDSYRSRFYLEFSIWPLKNRRPICKVVEELVEELLCVCETVPKSYFMPRLQTAIGVGLGFEGSGPYGSHMVYRMLVPLKAPPGHSFHLEEGPAGQTGERNSCLRVELQCTCRREELLGDMLCFLHHPEEQLRRRQMPSLLDTLCSDGYLDVQKTATWLQELVTAAWREMPQASTMQLEVLPSSRFCKFRLITASSQVIYVELMLGVQQGDSDTFLSFE